MMIFGCDIEFGFSERDWEIEERFVWWMGVRVHTNSY